MIFLFPKYLFVIKTETGHGSTQNTHTESKKVKLITEMIKICVITLFFCSIAGRHVLIQTELIEGPYTSTLLPGGLVHLLGPHTAIIGLFDPPNLPFPSLTQVFR